jgi:hypothetical protein
MLRRLLTAVVMSSVLAQWGVSTMLMAGQLEGGVAATEGASGKTAAASRKWGVPELLALESAAVAAATPMRVRRVWLRSDGTFPNNERNHTLGGGVVVVVREHPPRPWVCPAVGDKQLGPIIAPRCGAAGIAKSTHEQQEGQHPQTTSDLLLFVGAFADSRAQHMPAAVLALTSSSSSSLTRAWHDCIITCLYKGGEPSSASL